MLLICGDESYSNGEADFVIIFVWITISLLLAKKCFKWNFQEIYMKFFTILKQLLLFMLGSYCLMILNMYSHWNWYTTEFIVKCKIVNWQSRN